MSNYIETNAIGGFKVYGQQMVEYSVEGTNGKDFASAIAMASLAESTAIEVEADAFAAVVRSRQRKISELGDALAILSQAISTMKTGSGQTSSDTSDSIQALKTAQTYLSRYGLSLPLSIVDIDQPSIHICTVTRGDAERARANTEYAIDMENNDMQQDMITLQGLISKRDNSFSTASKVLKKVSSTTTSIIKSIGR